jgi:hypothetical protein
VDLHGADGAVVWFWVLGCPCQKGTGVERVFTLFGYRVV